MGQANTTFNIDELVSSYIDNQITDHELKKQIEDKLTSDRKLNAKYKSELLTKSILQSKLQSAELPGMTYNRVMASIDDIIANAAQNKQTRKQTSIQYPSFWQSLWQTISTPFLGVPKYAYGMALVFLVIGAIIIFTGKKDLNPYITSGTEKSIMVQAVNSFNKIIDGEVKPQLTSSNAAEVEQFVKDKSNFNAYIPIIENFVLKGVVCNEYKGQKLAHIIYQNGDEIFYIYQTPVTSVIRKDLDLPDAVHSEIDKSKYYMCDGVAESGDCTMTLWIKDNVVCASMCNVPKKEMYATFTSFYK
jgi:hypothetical protein